MYFLQPLLVAFFFLTFQHECFQRVVVSLSPSASHHFLPLCKKVTIHRVTTMLATSKNVVFSGHNHLLTTSTDDPSLAATWAIISIRSSAPVVSR